jgi:hypothetical protein
MNYWQPPIRVKRQLPWENNHQEIILKGSLRDFPFSVGVGGISASGVVRGLDREADEAGETKKKTEENQPLISFFRNAHIRQSYWNFSLVNCRGL